MYITFPGHLLFWFVSTLMYNKNKIFVVKIKKNNFVVYLSNRFYDGKLAYFSLTFLMCKFLENLECQ